MILSNFNGENLLFLSELLGGIGRREMRLDQETTVQVFHGSATGILRSLKTLLVALGMVEHVAAVRLNPSQLRSSMRPIVLLYADATSTVPSPLPSPSH